MNANAITNYLTTPAAVRIIPFAVFILFIVALSFLPAPTPDAQGAWDSRWVYAVRTVVVAALLFCFWRHYHELGRAALKQCEWFHGIWVGLAVFVAWIALDQPWARFNNEPGFNPLRADGTVDWTFVVPRLVGIALVVPVMEELFWRSFILRWIDEQDFLKLDPQRASRRAFVITAALFALEHNLWLAGLIAGAAYGWLYLRRGNLWTPIVAHAVTNSALAVWILVMRDWNLW